MNNNKTTGFGWIIFWLLIFWPVGIYLLVRKMANDKSAIMSGKTNSFTVVGWVLIFVGLTGISSGESGFFLPISFIIGGVVTLRKISEIKKAAERYKKYINIVINQNSKSIDNITAIVGLPYDVVYKDLEDMIDNGYLKDAYIHQGNREIVLRQEPSQSDTSYSQAKSKAKTIRCQGCGANNAVVEGRISVCEYCGTPIS